MCDLRIKSTLTIAPRDGSHRKMSRFIEVLASERNVPSFKPPRPQATD
jgi:hypothetical protein